MKSYKKQKNKKKNRVVSSLSLELIIWICFRLIRLHISDEILNKEKRRIFWVVHFLIRSFDLLWIRLHVSDDVLKRRKKNKLFYSLHFELIIRFTFDSTSCFRWYSKKRNKELFIRSTWNELFDLLWIRLHIRDEIWKIERKNQFFSSLNFELAIWFSIICSLCCKEKIIWKKTRKSPPTTPFYLSIQLLTL